MKNKSLLLVLASSLLALASCGGESPAPSDSSSSNPEISESSSSPNPDVSSSEPKVAETKTIAELLDLCPMDGSKSEKRYRVKATVKTVSNAQYGEMTISDETGDLYVYGTYSADGTKRYGELPEAERPVAGDEVLLEGNISYYAKKSIKQFVSAWIISFEHKAPVIDEGEYAKKTIAEVRSASDGTKVKIENAEVLSILYGNKLTIKSGVLIGDGTSSIYVYSTDVASQVSVGDKITLTGSKTHYILPKESSAAAAYGYQGACQLENATLVRKEAGTGSLDLSFAETKTIQEILSTPITQDITSLVYKTTAYVTKSVVSGKGGFTNYYFNDLDGKTGSYAYSQASGADFAWVDPYVDKFCTVYLTALNAKSTTYGCSWRFVPVQIQDDGYTFDKNEAGDYAIRFEGADQFESTYYIDPALEVTTSVSSELLGFDSAKISYSSSNEAVASFQEENGKTVFHMNGVGQAEITLTAGVDGYAATTKKISVERKAVEDIPGCVGVAGAKEAAKESEVIVKGIVGPSLTVQSGFYLFDEDGAIPVVVHDEEVWFKRLAMGQQIVLKAQRDVWKSEKYDYGTQCLSNAVLVRNEYGNHEIPDSAFVQGKTVDELRVLPVANDDVTLNVYQVTSLISKGTGDYPTYYLGDGSKDSLQIYSSSITQYAFLDPYVGKTVSVEMALCNWNSKSFFKGAVLSVTGEDGVKVYNKLHFNK